MSKRLPTEFAINMFLEKFLLVQQTELEHVSKTNYFDDNNPCHIYFIFKRPRLSLIPEKTRITSEKIYFYVYEHKQEQKIEHELDFFNNLGTLDIKIESEYPYNYFKILRDNEPYSEGRIQFLFQTNPFISKDFFDLEVLYIGQSYGVDGARTAPDRLKNHSTLQGIYAEAISNNPDSEIVLGLASFTEINLTVMNGFHKFTDEEKQADIDRSTSLFKKLITEGMNEQQKINFTEASLIRYFQPPYNKIYKGSFPNPAHKTYSECYDLDINSVGFEMQTEEMINCQIYSETITKKPVHYVSYPLHSAEDRKSIFDIF